MSATASGFDDDVLAALACALERAVAVRAEAAKLAGRQVDRKAARRLAARLRECMALVTEYAKLEEPTR